MIQKLWLQDYRNYSSLLLPLGQRCHVILGPNNQGKTNFLESVHVLMNGRSPLDAPLEHLLAFDTEEALMGADVLSAEYGQQRIYLKLGRDGRKTLSRDGEVLTRFSSLKTSTITSYLSPDILRVFQDAPSGRRQLIDRFCSMAYTECPSIMKRYDRVLKQKNAILKTGHTSSLGVWNQQLIELAYEIYRHRHMAFEHLAQVLSVLLDEVKPGFAETVCFEEVLCGGDHDIEDYRSWLTQKLDENIDKEASAGFALYGPHRDDFKILINGRSLFDFFSRGINRMVAILLKVSEMMILESTFKGFPVLLLDDTFAELDLQHKRDLMALLSKKTQVIYATVLDEDRSIVPGCDVIEVSQGALLHV